MEVPAERLQFSATGAHEFLRLPQGGIQEPDPAAEPLEADALPQRGDLLLRLTAVRLGDLLAVLGVFTHGRIHRHRTTAAGQPTDRLGRQDRS